MTAAAIIVDMWHSYDNLKKNNIDVCTENIKKFCIGEKNIKHILLATYSQNNNVSMPKEEPYWSNAELLFNQETKFEAMRAEWENSNFSTVQETCEKLLTDWPREDQNKCAIFSSLQLLYYCNFIDPDISKLYFFGQAWDICVKFRPVGWVNANSFNFHNLFNKKIVIQTNINCVLGENSKFINNIDDPWKLANCDGTYILTEDMWE